VRLALFDIDGTLLDSCAADAACYRRAVEPLVGVIGDDWSRFNDITDEGILRELLGRIPSDDERASVQRTLVRLLAECAIEPMPGVREFIEAIERDDGWRGALATGAWECSARQKLRAAGIDVAWPFASADDSPIRATIARIAIARACDAYGCDFDGIVLVGDSEWDRVTAETLGIGFVHLNAGVADVAAMFATMRAACTGAFSAATATSGSSTSGR